MLSAIMPRPAAPVNGENQESQAKRDRMGDSETSYRQQQHPRAAHY